MHMRTIASVGYQRKFHNATGIRHLETLLHWTLSCLLASLFRCLVLTAPPWIHANFSVRLSLVQSPLPSVVSCRNSQLLPASLLSSHQLPLLLSNYQLLSPRSRRQLSFASPYHFRVRRDFFLSKNPLSGFAPKQTRLLWRPTPIVLHGHLPLITKTIPARRIRHAGHCWRSRDELLSDVLQSTHTYGRAKAGRPAWTYIQ